MAADETAGCACSEIGRFEGPSPPAGSEPGQGRPVIISDTARSFMNVTTPSPPRLLRIAAAAARWLLALVVAGWLLVGLCVVVLHAWIVPRIGEWRGALEAQASRLAGVPVRIGSLEAYSRSLFPTIELHDVVLEDPGRGEALRLARVVASVSPRSLWHRGFEQLYIERPELDVRRDADGRLRIAGVVLNPDDRKDDSPGADWLFSQREVVVEHGTVRWTDETRDAPTLTLADVRFVVRNGVRSHAMRLDATPPEGWGQRFSINGRFRQPLLSLRSGDWRDWSGQLYADLPAIDVTRLGQYVKLDARIREGEGAVRAWIDVESGRAVGGAADLALSRIDAVLGAQLEPLQLRDLTGRLAVRATDQLFEFSTQNLQFATGDGQRWPGGNFWLRTHPANGRTPESGALRADQLDLGAMALIADRLPIGTQVRRLLAVRAPRGLLEHIEGSWQGPADSPTRYQARLRVKGLAVAADGRNATPDGHHLGSPGVRGLDAEVDLNQAGGTARLAIRNGAVDVPGVFEEPWVRVDRLDTTVHWTRKDEDIDVRLPDLRLANADAEGSAQIRWHTGQPAPAGQGRFPGVLDLTAQLTRADGTRVHRYLPLGIPAETRHYVRDAVVKGRASDVQFRIRGDLHHVPSAAPQDAFRITAQVQDVHFNYVPHVPTGHAAWPAVTGLSGELVFDRQTMQVLNARGRMAGAPSIELVKGEARIPDLAHAPRLLLQLQARGPVADLLRQGAPLTGDARSFIGGIQASGNADYRFDMDMPLTQMAQTQVKASVALPGNDVRLVPNSPSFTQVKGTLQFTDSGFSLAGVQAQLAGGPIRIEGQGGYGGTTKPLALKAQGQFTAEGLRTVEGQPELNGLAGRLQGGSSYTASLQLQNGVPDFQFESSLQGLGMDLPAPLGKSAEATRPLRLGLRQAEEARRGRTETIDVRLGDVASAEYVRELDTPQPTVVRGALRVGTAVAGSKTLPANGVLAQIHLDDIDVDAWRALATQKAPAAPATPAPPGTAQAVAASPWLPNRVALQAGRLQVAGRTLHDLTVDGTIEGNLYKAKVQARELSGSVEYRNQAPAQVKARLAYLRIAPGESREQVESLLDTAPPEDLPALDVVVDDLELLGRHLGRAEVVAATQSAEGGRREWRLDKLAFTLPEARLEAKGRWAPPTSTGAKRHMTLDFTLDMQDAGALLGRFGMPGVLASGKGQLGGSVNWQGSPFDLDLASLGGQLHVDVTSGQFLKAEPGIAKLLGVINLQALPRRLTLDFRDLFSAGFAFDQIRGDARIANGIASTNNLQMKGVNAAVFMDGSADIAHETQQLRVVVIPEINAGTAALVATAINPAIGLGTFLAQMVLSRPLVAATTQEFLIDGTWADPRVVKVPRAAAQPGAGTATDNESKP